MKSATPREEILIRPAEPEDWRALQEIYGCPKAMAGTLQLPYPSAELWRKRLLETAEGHYSLVAVVGGRLVGQLGLHTFANRPRRKHAATFGMAVHDDWQGKGIGTALLAAAIEMADKWLNIARLELEVYVDNDPAIKLYERFGFELEGRLRQHAFRDGRYVDSFMMARLRPAGEDNLT